jgi:hypothetical protein
MHDTRFIDVIDRMRRDIDAQRERAHQQAEFYAKSLREPSQAARS